MSHKGKASLSNGLRERLPILMRSQLKRRSTSRDAKAVADALVLMQQEGVHPRTIMSDLKRLLSEHMDHTLATSIGAIIRELLTLAANAGEDGKTGIVTH